MKTVLYPCPSCDKANTANTCQVNCECGKVYWTDRLDDDGQPPRISIQADWQARHASERTNQHQTLTERNHDNTTTKY